MNNEEETESIEELEELLRARNSALNKLTKFLKKDIEEKTNNQK